MTVLTLKESGYTGWPYIHAANDVCFVWYSISRATKKSLKDLRWFSFSRTRSTGKLVRHGGHLVTALVPSRWYQASLDQLQAYACEHIDLGRLPRHKEWAGPFLYMRPNDPPAIGAALGNAVLVATSPVASEGVQLSYGVNPQNLAISLVTAT